MYEYKIFRHNFFIKFQCVLGTKEHWDGETITYQAPVCRYREGNTSLRDIHISRFSNITLKIRRQHYR